MYRSLIPSSVGDLGAIFAEAQEYSASVAIPPYFADSAQRMPVSAFYDTSMGPEALPLQFVRIPLDNYLPKIFGQVGIGGADLEALYDEVLRLPPPTTAPSTAPSSIPTKSPVSRSKLRLGKGKGRLGKGKRQNGQHVVERSWHVLQDVR